MAVDLLVHVGMQGNADVGDAYDVREALVQSLASAPVREIGGGTNFEPLVVDAQFEAKNTRDAYIAVGIVSAALLKQGFAVRTPSEKLIVADASQETEPLPGVAHVEIVAPLGQS